MQSITDPKVFISYAWGTDEYQQKVLDLCTRLYSECGIEVLIDKWSMEAGNDTYDFMERCVKDPSVNYVIMLLDKNYAEKADNRQGGVGTETQIISQEVYSNTVQNKFIPVIFERGPDEKIYKPAYLKSRLHFDLTKDNANAEFMRLVKHLYGEKTYPMPQTKGTKPDWVSQPEIVPSVVSGPLFTIQNASDDVLVRSEIRKALNLVKESVFTIEPTSEEKAKFRAEPQTYLDFLGTLRPYRDAFIKALENITHKEYFTDVVADFFEEYRQTQDDHRDSDDYPSQARRALLHEMFIYTIALLWGAEEYSKIRDLITRTYFLGGKYRENKTAKLTDIVYAGGHTNLIENAKKKVDNKNYYSGLAQQWSEHVMAGYSLDQVTFADLLIYNLSVLEEPENTWYWFPMLYVYGLENPMFSRFAIRLKSAHQLKRLAGLVGDASPAGIDERIQKMVKLSANDKYRYNSSFEEAPLILDYVKADEIGKLP
ncbi:toll/interleukin-1 receptor domain-containing protein [Syntrophomonas wolfei]|mgnify:CR=1 FL=1|jgi:hypothetical protein|uniref:toll/interleukin-1 receptor domain-containing protein n=1 Tax=Syntrophomonas wolfei TaxID=863 RepID=UPI0023F3AA72|nr:toll/interleukin-1 receptor domain-containing protein [Syntrophomonas wolfei]